MRRLAVTADWQARKFHLRHFLFNTRGRGCACFRCRSRLIEGKRLRLITAADVDSVNFSKHSLIREKLSDRFFSFLSSPSEENVTVWSSVCLEVHVCRWGPARN